MADLDDIDKDKLATVAMHYSETVLSGRIPGLKLLHYLEARHGCSPSPQEWNRLCLWVLMQVKSSKK